MNLKICSIILLITSVSKSNTIDYTEAENKLAEGIYIASGLRDNLNNYSKYLENQVDKKYKPILGWTFSTIDVIIKQRIELNLRF